MAHPGKTGHPRACGCCGAPYEPRCSYCQRVDYDAMPTVIPRGKPALRGPMVYTYEGQEVSFDFARTHLSSDLLAIKMTEVMI